ncbi:MAG: ornithine cyclodeaminase family protein [Planctomycetota bacterium]|nr:ornithine cyclodeaminase family protein [Planctomycetota bacterium]
MKMNVRVVDNDEVVALLSMNACIDLMDDAFKAYSKGECDIPLRSIIWLPDKSGGLGVMPGYFGPPESASEALGLKVVTVFPKNEGTPYESHQGVVILFDVENGRTLTILDACEITTIRTAGASGAATRLLAREEASSLAILGTGTQARSHLDAMLAVRPIKDVRIWGRNTDKAVAFATRESKRLGLDVKPAPKAREAVECADIICTVTGSREPILDGAWIKPGTHINAVGACIPVARELDTEAVRNSRLYVDSRESAINESGDYLIPLKEGAIHEDHIVGEIGDLLTGRIEGRRSAEEITLFKSLGLAMEDLVVAKYILAKAIKTEQGHDVIIGGCRRDEA